MSVRLVFLGKLADLAGAPEQEQPGPFEWGSLVAALPPALATELASERVRVAVNGEVLADKSALRVTEGDEVAFLPPVSGG